MKLLIGLGNPGEKYKNNRHNAGARCAQFLISNWLRAPSELQFLNKFQILISQSFMNDSGKFVKEILTANRYSLTALYVAHDDLDIPLGKYKIQFGVGPKVHNGVKSVEEALGTGEFWRVRIGIDNRNARMQEGKNARMAGEEYVLQDFTKEELEILERVFGEIAKDLHKSTNVQHPITNEWPSFKWSIFKI